MDAQNPQLLNPIFERRKRHMPKKNGIYYRRKEGRKPGTRADAFCYRRRGFSAYEFGHETESVLSVSGSKSAPESRKDPIPCVAKE